MNTVEFAKRVISSFNKKITNEVFLLIQNDRELMQEYLELVEQYKTQTVNMAIGKAIKDCYGLENDENREENPKCTLILSHQKFQ